MNAQKIAYWVVTGLMCALFIFSAQMYIFNTDMAKGFFASLGFPTWFVIPLAMAKILGVMSVLTDFSKILREWAYAGFFFDVVLATSAHLINADGQHLLSSLGVVLVLLSRYLYQYRYL